MHWWLGVSQLSMPTRGSPLVPTTNLLWVSTSIMFSLVHNTSYPILMNSFKDDVHNILLETLAKEIDTNGKVAHNIFMGVGLVLVKINTDESAEEEVSRCSSRFRGDGKSS